MSKALEPNFFFRNFIESDTLNQIEKLRKKIEEEQIESKLKLDEEKEKVNEYLIYSSNENKEIAQSSFNKLFENYLLLNLHMNIHQNDFIEQLIKMTEGKEYTRFEYYINALRNIKEQEKKYFSHFFPSPKEKSGEEIIKEIPQFKQFEDIKFMSFQWKTMDNILTFIYKKNSDGLRFIQVQKYKRNYEKKVIAHHANGQYEYAYKFGKLTFIEFMGRSDTNEKGRRVKSEHIARLMGIYRMYKDDVKSFRAKQINENNWTVCLNIRDFIPIISDLNENPLYKFIMPEFGRWNGEVCTLSFIEPEKNINLDDPEEEKEEEEVKEIKEEEEVKEIETPPATQSGFFGKFFGDENKIKQKEYEMKRNENHLKVIKKLEELDELVESIEKDRIITGNEKKNYKN